jgi:hypothetical protein
MSSIINPSPSFNFLHIYFLVANYWSVPHFITRSHKLFPVYMLTAEDILLYIILRPHNDLSNSADSKSINFGLLYHAINDIFISRILEFYLMNFTLQPELLAV